jgi:FixJ family two-component response regulator
VSKTKVKIYIVDDDESVRRALSRLMKAFGYQAETFNSAQSFLDSVPVDTQGILILDVRMPDIGGFELQNKLGTLSSKLQIIFITAHAEAGDRERAMAAGAKGFLQKPFSDESLLGLIESITSEGR